MDAVAEAQVLRPPAGHLEVLARGSRSFAFAGWFLPADRRAEAALLYAFCRFVDDIADEAADPAMAARDLALLEDELRGLQPARPLVAELRELFQRRGIDPEIAVQLVRGVGSDLGPVRLADDRALLRYAYAVASTVGLMMSGVLGVKDPRAAAFAVDLGLAMQLTNICRDVADDARLGRVYLPATRLAAAGVPLEPEALLVQGAGVARVVDHVLSLADRYYLSAGQGMRFIPWRARLAILIASRVYRGIGVRLRRLGSNPLLGRTVVPWYEKLWWLPGALSAWVLAPVRGAPHRAALHRELDGLPGAHHGDA